MRLLLWGLALVSVCVGTAQGLVITIQDATPAGTDPQVQDALLVKEVTNHPDYDDYNWGQTPLMRVNPDAASSYGNPDEYGPSHAVFQFDTSFFDGVPDPQVTSAKFRFYVCTRNNKKGAPAYIDMKLSRFLAGKDWIEGTGDGVMALDGEVTWNSQKHSANPAWATAGATGADTDIDTASTKTFTIAASAYNGEIRMIELDVTDFVQAWADGAENNGMNIWGGYTTSGVGALVYWAIVGSEHPGGDLVGGGVVITAPDQRPSLTVEYIPEPATLGLLALGFAPLLRRRR